MIHMDIQIECKHCGKVHLTKLKEIIKVLIETCENDSIYAGFLCNVCADELTED